MLDFSFGEIALVVLVALVVVGPKELPNLMRTIGRWFGQFKSITDEFREGFKSAMHDTSFSEAGKDLHEIHDEIRYIRDDSGKMQRVYGISDFVDTNRTVVTDIKKSGD